MLCDNVCSASVAPRPFEKCRPGRGERAANRCIYSNGDIALWVARSCRAVFGLSATRPAALNCTWMQPLIAAALLGQLRVIRVIALACAARQMTSCQRRADKNSSQTAQRGSAKMTSVLAVRSARPPGRLARAMPSRRNNSAKGRCDMGECLETDSPLVEPRFGVTAPPRPRPAAGPHVDRRALNLDQLARATLAIILAGGRGSRLQQLTDGHAKPAIPMAGHLRIIDFTLSNCLNSGLRQIGVLMQYKAQSQISHVTRGWGCLDAARGEFIDIIPAQQQVGEAWYRGTADALYQNLALLGGTRPSYVLILAGDPIYRMDYRALIASHVRQQADVTVACVEAPLAQASAFGVMRLDPDGRVISFEEKPVRPRALPDRPDKALASMGIDVFNAALLRNTLCQDACNGNSDHDFGKDVIPNLIRSARVAAYPFVDERSTGVDDDPCWRDVDTLDAYWETSMDPVRPLPKLNLYDDNWPIRGMPQPLPSAQFVLDESGCRGEATDSVVGGGCIVSGATVRWSMLFTRVRVCERSVVEHSMRLPNVVVGRNATVRRAIIDSGCVLPDGFQVGVCRAEDVRRFTVTEGGITLVTPHMLGQCAD